MKRYSRSCYKMFVLGVVLTTPFFALGQEQDNLADTYLLADIIQQIKLDRNIMIAFDPQAIENIKSDPSCIQADDVVDCLHRTHGDLFEIVGISTNKIMIRAYDFQNQNTISASVWDGQSNTPLVYAEIQSPSLNTFAISDREGNFSLDISNKSEQWKSQKVVVSYLGYRSVEMKLIDLIKNKKVRLTPRAYAAPIAHILVSKNNIYTTDDASSDIELQGAFMSKSNAVSGDLIRSLQILPGLSATNDFSSALRFRGSDEDQNLLLVGNIPLYQTGHYFNLFSVINDEAIESIKLYRNYLPVQYGDATESIVQLNPFNPNIGPPQLKTDVSLLTSDIFASTPIGKSLGISFSGRTTNGDIGRGSISDLITDNVSAFTIPTGDGGEIFNRSLQPDMQFQDVLSRLSWGVAADINMNVQYIYARDKANLTDAYTIQSRNGRAAANYNYMSEQEWTNQGLGADITKRWPSQWQSTINAYWSSFDRNDQTLSSLTRDRPGQSDPKIDVVQFTLNDAIDDKSLAISNSIPLSDLVKIQTGYQYQFASIDYSIDRKVKDVDFIDRSSSIHTLFVNSKINNKKHTSAELGFRSSYSSLAKQIYLSPRIQVFHQVSPSFRLKSSAGWYGQQLRTVNILTGNNESKSIWTLADGDDVPILRTAALMVGGNWIHNLFSFDAEIYYKKDDNAMQELIPEQMNQSQQQLATLNPELFIGKGRRFGLDLLLKRENKNHTSIISYSLSKSENSFEEYQHGSWISATDDRRHEVNWQHIQNMGKVSVFGTLILASPDPQFQINQNGQSDQSARYARNKAYQRVDLGIDYNFAIGHCDLTVGASVFNVFNRQNTSSVRYARVDEFQQQQRSSFFTETISLLDRTFNLRLQMSLK